MGKPICDVANGALHFSLLAGGELEQWPDRLDIERVRQFLAGYEEVRGIGTGRMQALPFLMIEALIAESVLPIAATGSFGPYDGLGFMQMVRRKVGWIQQNIEKLQAVTEAAD